MAEAICLPSAAPSGCRGESVADANQDPTTRCFREQAAFQRPRLRTV